MALLLRLLSSVRILIGICGLVALPYCAYSFWKIISGPGDENPVGLLFFAGFFASLLPAGGLLHRPTEFSFGFLLWAALSVGILYVLGSFLTVFF